MHKAKCIRLVVPMLVHGLIPGNANTGEQRVHCIADHAPFMKPFYSPMKRSGVPIQSAPRPEHRCEPFAELARPHHRRIRIAIHQRLSVRPEQEQAGIMGEQVPKVRGTARRRGLLRVQLHVHLRARTKITEQCSIPIARARERRAHRRVIQAH